MLAAFDESKQTFELVGLTKFSALEGGGKKYLFSTFHLAYKITQYHSTSHFGNHFRRSADAIRAHYKHHTFEDSVIQLDKHELSAFVDMLSKNVARDEVS